MSTTLHPCTATPPSLPFSYTPPCTMRSLRLLFPANPRGSRRRHHNPSPSTRIRQFMSSSNLAALQSSTLSMPYLDANKMLEVLDQIFGRNNYQIKVGNMFFTCLH